MISRAATTCPGLAVPDEIRLRIAERARSEVSSATAH